MDVAELDRHVIFLRDQANRLDKLAEERRYRWAELDAQKLRRIAEILLEMRRDQQMTGMHGKRIG